MFVIVYLSDDCDLSIRPKSPSLSSSGPSEKRVSTYLASDHGVCFGSTGSKKRKVFICLKWNSVVAHGLYVPLSTSGCMVFPESEL